jgi:hypothetical protein
MKSNTNIQHSLNIPTAQLFKNHTHALPNHPLYSQFNTKERLDGFLALARPLLYEQAKGESFNEIISKNHSNLYPHMPLGTTHAGICPKP